MLLVILLTVSVILALIYINGEFNERYWKKRGVKFHKRNKCMGLFWDFLTTNKPLFESFTDLYKEHPNEPAVGVGSLLTPAIYVRDPVNVHHVFALNFSAFNHRGFVTNEGDLLADNILFQNGDKWKLMRQSMSPLFTSAKLRNMFYITDKSAQDFVQYIKDDPKLMKGNAFHTLSTFCCAAISAAVFGVTTQSIFESPFLSVAQNAFRAGFKENIKFTISNLSYSLFKLFNIYMFKDYEEFFISAIKNVVQQRKLDKIKRYDFADICVELQNKGTIKDHVSGLELEPTDELLAAQAFFFFIAGVEPSASAMFNTLLELGRNPDCLERLQKEIDEAFDKHEGKLTYDIVSGMEYLDMVMSEVLRLYPPIGFLTRQCIQNTTLPVGNIKIDKGTKIFTPIYDIHHDPKYYVDPEVFNPERFSKDNRDAIADTVYMPFGRGNRICIGKRYAQLQAKSGLVHLLRNFSIKTHISKGGIKYHKDLVQVRLKNVDVELVLRNVKC